MIKINVETLGDQIENYYAVLNGEGKLKRKTKGEIVASPAEC